MKSSNYLKMENNRIYLAGLLFAMFYLFLMLQQLRIYESVWLNRNLVFIFDIILLSISTFYLTRSGKYRTLSVFYSSGLALFFLLHINNDLNFNSFLYVFPLLDGLAQSIAIYIILFESDIYVLSNRISMSVLKVLLWSVIFGISLFYTLNPFGKYFEFFYDFGNLWLKSDLLAIAFLLTLEISPVFVSYFLSLFYVLILIFIGSRSSLVSFVIALFCYFFVKNVFRKPLTKLLLLVMFFSVATIIYFFSSDLDIINLITLLNLPKELLNRLYTLSTLKNDESLNLRLIQYKYFLETTVNSGVAKFMFGGGAPQGYYVHNLLSLWQYFGFGIFLSSLLIIGLGFISMLFNIRYRKWQSLLPTYLFVLLQSITARAFVSSTVSFLLITLSMAILLKTNKK